MTDQTAVLVEGLRKNYGRHTALAGLDLSVSVGSVHGVLGPNGAGKTTAVRILSTLLAADGGRAEVLGVDVLRHPERVRPRIGLTGQYAAVDERLTGLENLEMFGRLYRLRARTARARAIELLERFELTEASRRQIKTYSGGMRRRLDLAASLIMAPAVLFLDEPTTGLDPRSRQAMWRVIADLVREGTTVLLTTQYLEEADQLADRVSVIDGGRVIAEGTSDDLKRQIGGDRLEITIAPGDDLDAATAVLSRLGTGPAGVAAEERRVTVPVAGAAVLAEAVRSLDEIGATIVDVGLHRPSLDDVFMALTGHGAAGGADGSDGADGADGGKDAVRPPGPRSGDDESDLVAT
ncbi:ABC-2 type transport system ATP-binding protein [Parafrankia irregularis]|uniref:ABC-2 type transport system ATP-binding protein n=1 Tax=Parafrankia irregularis TaxID=795642 RepID=A0A0S4QXN6_9ACTN|nr:MULTISPECIES: ATP-binding cassette domain-containing protein [Parafrankia]MBE3201901.1 ATP-binding cassette domain-containing protein [Parafrankia sp. CH37]CUU59512.1 ABC-2 type transport system ATP-binding protein [Parafrankia irregularis]